MSYTKSSMRAAIQSQLENGDTPTRSRTLMMMGRKSVAFNGPDGRLYNQLVEELKRTHETYKPLMEGSSNENGD